MGAKCCRNDNYRAEMLSEIQNFNFNDNAVEFPLESRVIRELMLDTRTVYQLQICLKKFLLENAYLIKEQKLSIKEKGIESRISAPPLLDQVWQMAILYSQNYIKICKKLVGCIIDREYSPQNIHKKILKKMLPEYDDKIYQIEYEYTIWVQRNDLEQVIQNIYSVIIEEERIGFEFILQLMMQIKINLCKKEIKKLEIKKKLDKNIDEVLKKIHSSLPQELELILMHKFCLSQQLAKIYIDEYCHYMTMLKFTKFILVPSEEVDQVWHTHQCMTKQYRQFCTSIFDRFIYHNPANSNKQSQMQDYYAQTLQQYQKFFNYQPNPQVWPSKEERWNPLNFLGSWVNLFRLCMSIIQVIQDKLQPTSLNILLKYQQWKGTNLFRDNQEIEIKKIELNVSTQIQSERYWDVGCYALTELEEDRFQVNQKNELFFDDDVIINSIK